MKAHEAHDGFGDLRSEVTRNKGVKNSTNAMVRGIGKRIEENKSDTVALQKMADELKADNGQFATAVEANDPDQANRPAGVAAGGKVREIGEPTPDHPNMADSRAKGEADRNKAAANAPRGRP